MALGGGDSTFCVTRWVELLTELFVLTLLFWLIAFMSDTEFVV
jgi:hypothetical protein